MAARAQHIGVETQLGIARIELVDHVAAFIDQRELSGDPGDVLQDDVETGVGVGLRDVDGVEKGAGIAVFVRRGGDFGDAGERDGRGLLGRVVGGRGVLAAGRREGESRRREKDHHTPEKHEIGPQDGWPLC